ncbi:hypothetical protein F5144DRAFT_552418, partial [Chaetomium tenue]
MLARGAASQKKLGIVFVVGLLCMALRMALVCSQLPLVCSTRPMSSFNLRLPSTFTTFQTGISPSCLILAGLGIDTD